ncbi:MAG: glycosyltransferase [Treponema sp.]|nr:glycosyltransferase [Treponema sp.]
MNIALFSDSYIPTKSGVVTVIMQLRKVLSDMGHHVVVVTVSEHSATNITENGMVLRVQSITVPVGDSQYLGLPHKIRVLDFLKSHNVQIIHSHTEFSIGHMAIVAGHELGIPVIATTHTMWEDYYRHYLTLGNLIPRKVVRKMVQQAYKQFYAFINVSQKAHDYFNRSFMLPKTPSAIIPNAIDIERFSKAHLSDEDVQKLRSSLGLRPEDTVLLYVGRVVEEKRVEELCDLIINITKKNQHIKTVFVGSGGAAEYLEESVRKNNLSENIIFTGFVDYENLPRYYALGDIFITASLSEMHSMTILEALAAGLPIVCRRDASFSDTVYDGKNGFQCDTDGAMEETLLELASQKEKCAEFGQFSRTVAKQFSFTTYGKRHVAFYNAVLDVFPDVVSSQSLEAAVSQILS